jgi:hypothetical protein
VDSTRYGFKPVAHDLNVADAAVILCSNPF